MISTKSRVTEEQLRTEKEYNDIVDLCENSEISKGEANEQLEELVSNAYAKKILSDDDEKDYDFRRDPEGRRSHIDFSLQMRSRAKKEEKVLGRVRQWAEGRGKATRFEPLGSDAGGYILLANVAYRKKTPYDPDYNAWMDERFFRLEIKYFSREEMWLKLSNVRGYRKKQSYIALGFKGLYYFFKKKSIIYMLENVPFPYQQRKGKEAIIITMDGKYADFSLKKMVDDKLVTWMK